MEKILEVIAGVGMMFGALFGMIVLIAGLSLAIMSPIILIVWLALKSF